MKRQYMHTDYSADANANESIIRMMAVLKNSFDDEIDGAESRKDERAGNIGHAAAEAQMRDEIRPIFEAYKAARAALDAARFALPCVIKRRAEFDAKTQARAAREDARQRRHLDKIGFDEAMADFVKNPAG